MPSTFGSIPTPLSVLSTPSPASPWAIPNLFPSQSLNYVVGGMESGKTLLTLYLLNEYAGGRGFLGYGLDLDMDEDGTPTSIVSPPLSIGVIVCGGDRTQFRQTVQKFSFLKDHRKFPIAFINPDPTAVTGVDIDAVTLAVAYDELTADAGGHRVKLLLLENLQNLMSSGKLTDMRSVWEFCRVLHNFADERGVTILGTVPTTKQRRGEYYSNLGDRVYGSVAWPQAAATLLVLEDFDGDTRTEKKSSLKRLFLQPRHTGRKILYADFDLDGVLKPIAGPSEEKITRENSLTTLDDRLKLEPTGAEFTKEDVKDWEVKFAGKKIKSRTIERWLETRTDSKVLEKSGAGRATAYKKL